MVLVIASWGAGAAAGAFFGLWQFKVRPTLHDGIKGLRARWHMSKWLAGNSHMGWSASQASVLLAGFILGPAGSERSGPHRRSSRARRWCSSRPVEASGLPEASRALLDRGWGGLRRVSFVVSAAACEHRHRRVPPWSSMGGHAAAARPTVLSSAGTGRPQSCSRLGFLISIDRSRTDPDPEDDSQHPLAFSMCRSHRRGLGRSGESSWR